MAISPAVQFMARLRLAVRVAALASHPGVHCSAHGEDLGADSTGARRAGSCSSGFTLSPCRRGCHQTLRARGSRTTPGVLAGRGMTEQSGPTQEPSHPECHHHAPSNGLLPAARRHWCARRCEGARQRCRVLS